MRTLSRELGIDVKACVEAVYDLALLAAESDAKALYVAMGEETPSKRERRLAAENAAMRRQAQKVIAVNRRMWELLAEEQHFLERGWLKRCMSAACHTNDRGLVQRLGKIQDLLDAGKGKQNGNRRAKS